MDWDEASASEHLPPRLPHQPRNPLPHILQLRLQLGVGILPQLDELVVVLDGFFPAATSLVQFAEARGVGKS